MITLSVSRVGRTARHGCYLLYTNFCPNWEEG